MQPLQTEVHNGILYVVRYNHNGSRVRRVLYIAHKDREYKEAQGKVSRAASIFATAIGKIK